MIEHDYYLLIPKKIHGLERDKLQVRRPPNYTKSKVPVQNYKNYTNELHKYYVIEKVDPSDLREQLMNGTRPIQVVTDGVSRGGKIFIKKMMANGIRPTAIVTDEGVIVEGRSMEKIAVRRGMVISDSRVLLWALLNRIIVVNARLVVIITCYALQVVSYAVLNNMVSGTLAIPSLEVVTPEQASLEVARILGRR